MAPKQSLKQGEKILFGIAIVFVIAAVIGYVAMETYRARSDKPVFASKTHFNLSPAGLRGSATFRKSRCTSCHRALRNGTNMGLSLDGVGSRRSREWLYNFLRDPEATYGSPTLDHGYPPKEAAYVASLPDKDLQDMAAFISELKADQGSASAPQPPSGRSEFIDSMVGAFAPESWKGKYQDVRDKDQATMPQQGESNEQ
ncbi:MAG: c-type cytochrome [Gammaproteobacteria bacterium]